jgi:uncharacterized membrane protein YphA (DoxX/SURF4 family)
MLDRSLVDLATIDTRPDAGAQPVGALPLAEVRPRWNLATRVAFRLSFVYFTLYVVTTQMLGGLLPFGWIPDIGGSVAMRRMYAWVGAHVFRLGSPVSFQPSGSGDKLVNYLQVASLLLIAVGATAIWSVVDRRRPDHRALNKWFRVFLRFALGSTMISYGMVKAFPLQMPAPGLQRLLEPFGNFSPMGVLWYSIGASKSYEMFAGFMEILCGVLLFVPQLATLGAMVTFATTVHIFTLNMTYDVPVKLFSFQLILMSMVLMAPEATRIANVILFNRTALPSTQPPLFKRRAAVLAVLAVQLVYGGYLVWNDYTGARRDWTTRGGGAPRSPLYGIWNIERMTIDGHERSPLVTDYGRWRRVLFQAPTAITFQRMDDTFVGYPAKIDVAAKTIAITTVPNVPNAPPATNGPTTTFTFHQPDPEHLILEGSLDGRKLRMEGRLFDRNKFLLVTRGFNWIQERPFNR